MNPKGKKMASGLFPAVLGSYEGLYRQKSTVTSLGCNKDYLIVWIHLFATLARPWARFYATFTFSVQQYLMGMPKVLNFWFIDQESKMH